jgi:uncharacterized protein YdaU (DUF1376 family)
MSARPWYKRYPADFIAGTLALTLEQKGAYSMILDLMYDRGGPIPDDPQWIARVCGCSPRKWNSIRKHLIEVGKISAENGVLTNFRVEKQAENEAKEARKLAENGAKGGNKNAENTDTFSKNNGLEEKGQPIPHKHTRSQKPDREEVPPVVPRETETDEVRLAVDGWNALASEVGLAPVMKLTAARRAKCHHRLQDCGGLDGWNLALAKIRGDPFFQGAGERGWKADFDFLMQEKSFVKLMEGGFDKRSGGKTSNGKRPTDDELRRRFARAASHNLEDERRDSGGCESGAAGQPGDRNGYKPSVGGDESDGGNSVPAVSGGAGSGREGVGDLFRETEDLPDVGSGMGGG